MIRGDVILGADDVHSICRRKISGDKIKPVGSGKSAFRFLIDRKALKQILRLKVLCRTLVVL